MAFGCRKGACVASGRFQRDGIGRFRGRIGRFCGRLRARGGLRRLPGGPGPLKLRMPAGDAGVERVRRPKDLRRDRGWRRRGRRRGGGREGRGGGLRLDGIQAARHTKERMNGHIKSPRLILCGQGALHVFSDYSGSFLRRMRQRGGENRVKGRAGWKFTLLFAK